MRVEATTVGVDRFRTDVIRGLSATPKALPCKYLYDARGSELFERICALDEYYLTRTELAIMEQHAKQMASQVGARALLIEFGSGSGRKTELLLEELRCPAGYVPIEISRTALVQSSDRLRKRFPGLRIMPVCADFTETVVIPEHGAEHARRVLYFPGSTIGNLNAAQSERVLSQVARLIRPGGMVLLGIDLKKDLAVLQAAYDDSEGVTAAFILNVLRRINRELDANFDLDAFRYEMVLNEAAGRIEAYVASDCAQTVNVAGRSIRFARNERILVEYSHKYSVEQFSSAAANAGLTLQQTWTDSRRWFAVLLLTA